VVAGGLSLLVQACGGRSSTDFTIYDESGQGGAQNSGGQRTTGGAFSAGGSFSSGGGSVGGGVSTGGSFAAGGSSVGTGGAQPFGGSVGFAGSVGVGGVGAGPNGGTVAEACSGFCQPYALLCSNDGLNAGECTSACIQDLRGSPADCRRQAIDALSCLGSVLRTQADCQQGMLAAAVICGGLLGNLECSAGSTPPPDCPGFGSSSPGSCSLTYDCGPGRSYGVECSDGQGQSTCYCLRNGVSTGEIVQVSGPDACATAYDACGF
jgi:hypothetical protein